MKAAREKSATCPECRQPFAPRSARQRYDQPRCSAIARQKRYWAGQLGRRA